MNSAVPPSPATVPVVDGPIPRLRWTICALLFFATTINYVDRAVFSVLAPQLQKTIGWSEIDYSNIVMAFTAAYAIGLAVVGNFIDRVGVRRGYATVISVWSTAAMSHAAANSVGTFGAARFALGLGESGNFPAAIKTVAEWFPKKERALATGIFNAGSNVGAILAPLFVPWVAANLGWRYAFICTGLLSVTWLACWLWIYRRPEDHPRLSPRELAYIRSDPAEAITPIPWKRLLPLRQTWGFAIGKFLTDPIWWFYLYWLPKFLNAKFGLDLEHIGPPLVVIYVVADVGSIFGGWLSSGLIKRGWSINAGRKTALLGCALAVVPIMMVPFMTNLWIVVGLLGLATAAHQGWSANLFTLTSDTFPRRAVGSVVGIGGMAGAIGGVLLSKGAGYILEWTGSYMTLFIIAGSAYLIALAIIHTLMPKLEPASVD